MNGTVFVDTNVLVYRRDRSETEKQPRAQEWLELLWKERTGRLSSQVLNEFYVTVTQKLSPGLDVESARREVRSLFAWRPVPTSRATIETAWGLHDRYQLSFWDGLIVAAAILTGCRYLLSEDLQDGQVIDGIRVIDPFAHRPEELE